MAKDKRQERIVTELASAPTMRVQDLAERLAVSTETIRRDLGELERKGLINRTYGGAVRPVTVEPALAERQNLLVEERRRIAAHAVGLVETDDILMLGGGATTLHFARALAARGGPLTVITHAPSIAMALAADPLIKVMMLPGLYDGREGLIHGPDTIDALGRFRANIAVLGASGLTAEGPSDAALGPGLIYGTMMRRASQAMVLADHQKFDQPSLTVYGSWGPSVTLITDRAPAGALAGALRQADSPVAVADRG